MKIAVDVRMMFSSGIGSYIRHLVPRVMRVMPEAQFTLLGRPSEMERWEGFIRRPGVEWIEAKSAIFTIAEQWELFRKIPQDVDLFWSPNYNFPVLWKGPFVATVHDVFHLVMGPETSSLPKRLYARSMFSRLTRRAAALLCVSEFTKKELIGQTGVSANKTFAIPNGLDPSWFEVKRTKNPHSRPYLLFVGNVKPHKNLSRLLEAFEEVKDQIPHDLVLVGQKEGFLTGDPLVLEKAEHMGERIHFTGVVDDTLLGQYYAFADLLVFPSLYEGFGLPPLEAMACGTPVVVSKAASILEVCGEAALYFDPLSPAEIGEKILEVLGNESLRMDLVRKGRERAKAFSWDVCAERTIQVLKASARR